MKIVHCCLSCFYIDGGTYQENELVRCHVDQGHEVVVIASTENHDSAGRTVYGDERSYVGAEGARVRRLRYRRLPHRVATKLRAHPGVYAMLEEERPEVIVFHGLCGFELLTVSRWAAKNNVSLWVDSHEDHNNSARGFVSRWLLHGLYYRSMIAASRPFISNPVLCVSIETMDFVERTYGVARNGLRFFPLGGYPLEDQDYAVARSTARSKLGFGDEQVVFVQSGKFTSRKRLADSLRAFAEVESVNARFVIAGTLGEDVRQECERLIAADTRVAMRDWLDAPTLRELLVAADVYVQPGSQSVTMQNSICCRCAVIVDSVPSHSPFVRGNGWLVTDGPSLRSAIESAARADRAELTTLQQASAAVAEELLSYPGMAAELVPDLDS